MKKNNMNNTKKTRMGLLFTSVALTLAAVFTVGTVSAGALSVNRANAAYTAEANANDTVAMSIAKKVYAGHQLQQADYSKDVVLVDGERVYMDTRHLPPANTGKAIHVQASGKTSYGFNWTCSCDNKNYVIACNYNFSTNQYDFVIFGEQPGNATITIYYNINDTERLPKTVKINVDQNLNVTQL